MWKAPYRPRENGISQSYNDGLVDIYRVEDTAKPGYKPAPALILKGTLAFSEQSVGIQRDYLARQNQIQIEKILRVPHGFPVDSQDVAIIRGTDTQYRIDRATKARDVYSPSLDLTLVRVAQTLNVAGGDSQ